jgi:capsule polysaccharide export protein KpsE/RkpR
LAVNLNANPVASQTVANVFNSPPAVRDVTAQERRLQEQLQQQQSKITEAAKTPVIKSDAATVQRLDADRAKQPHANFDAPDRNTQKALTAYRDVGKAQEREKYQSLVGVDLFV